MPSPDAPARAKRTTFRIDYTPELLAELRHAFENTPQSLQQIATAHGFCRRTLAMKAEREGWVRFQRPALDLSPAAKLDARLAEAEAELAQGEAAFPLPPRALASGGEGSGVGGSCVNASQPSK